MSALDRRSFFKTGAAVVVAAPLAIDAQVKQLMANTGRAGGQVLPYDCSPGSQSMSDKLSEMIRGGQVPEWRMVEIQSEAKANARNLDPDLIASRSLSLSARVGIQEKRNLAAIINREGSSYLFSKARDAFWGGSW